MSDLAEARHTSYRDAIANRTADELESIIERLEELDDWGLGEGYNGIAHKIEEAIGPLTQAVEAARQYATGEVRPS